MAKESDIQVVDIIHCTENEFNEKDDDNEIKTPPGSENAQLFLSCGLDSLKAENGMKEEQSEPRTSLHCPVGIERSATIDR